MQERAAELLRLLNELDDYLGSRTDHRYARGFSERMDQVARRDPVVSRYREELREFAELRNAIVHGRGFPDDVIAEPNQAAVDRLRQIVEAIVDPPRLLPQFASDIHCLRPQTPLIEALRHMGKRGHSQVPVILADGTLGLLTSDGLTRWLAAQYASDDAAGPGVADIASTTVQDVLLLERGGSFELLPGDATHEQARAVFTAALGRGIRLRAVLITPSGKPSAKVQGIVTAADLLEG